MESVPVIYIPVLLGTSRVGRQSVRVARGLLDRLKACPDVQTELLDLAEYPFPPLRERLEEMVHPPAELAEFRRRLSRIDGLIVVAPEYKNGYPGTLKNALDHLESGIFRRKPIGIATVSSGGSGGLNCLAQLRLVCLAMGGFPIPVPFAVARVQEAFDEQGELSDPRLAARLGTFLDEVIWYSTATAQLRRTEMRSAAAVVR
jgi:NAD(P)H-dependent FMN reductase